MVDRDGGAGPGPEWSEPESSRTGTEIDLEAAAQAALDAVRGDKPSELTLEARRDKPTELTLEAHRDKPTELTLEVSRRDKPTELDLPMAAAAAVETTRRDKPTELGSAMSTPALEALRRDKPTELDLTMAAAAAIEAARLAAATPPPERALATPPEHTVIGPPSDTGESLPRKPRVSVFAPTAAVSELTADTPSPAGTTLEPMEELPEGTLLAGRYHIKELVGEGGMGAVYAAHDDDLDEEIALKVLRTDLGRDRDFQRRLKAEVRLARRVSHPNVCRVHDLGVDDEIVFVTMELVRGHTLRERLAEIHVGRAEPLELAQIVDIVVQLGAALSAAHRAGVIHRDVKPDNVILAGGRPRVTDSDGPAPWSGRAVLTDFGVASMASSSARPIVGTPAYLAPEVLLGEPSDHRVDVYAVACLAYELIAGAPPFAARTIELAIELARNGRAYAPLPEAFATPAVRIALDRVLARGLAADPAVRSSTIERFVDAFAHAARGAPLSTGLRGRTSDRLSTQDMSTPMPTARRTELRVTTALVWLANRSARDTEEAERIVVDAGGMPIRVAPGEIIALFGASRSTGADADRAATAALAVIAKFGGRIGLDTTRILLRPSDTDLAGPDSAVTAANLAQDAREGEVWASQVTARQLAARFEITATSSDARRVTGVRPLADSERAAARESSLRAAELQQLCTHIERACSERRPMFVEVRGAAGSGKTRLRKAMIATISLRREVDWLVASASPAAEAAPLSIVQSSSAEWYDATTGGGTIVDPAGRDLAARRWLEARAVHRPVVLVVEDLQWADPTSRALLDRLRSELDRVPVAIVTFVRSDKPEPVPDDRAAIETLWLGPLDNIRATLLAQSLAPAAPDDAIAEVVGRAAGNPFFVEELARELAAGRTASLPTSVEAVVQAHLDELPDVAARVAVTASVIGRGFWRRAVARLLPALGDAELDAALAELERHNVIAPATRTIVDDEYYELTSTLVRDVAYARIPARERRQLHAGVAGWLDEESRTASNQSARLLAVAHHREHAGDAQRAAVAYRLAGSKCLELFAYGEATAALRKAAALVAVPDPILEEELGDAIAQTEGFAAAEPVYQRALDETDDDDGPARARLWQKLGAAASKRGMTANAIARYRAGLAIAAPGGELAPWAAVDPRIAAQLWAGLGWTLGYQLGKVEEGHPFCERAVAALEATPYRRELAQALSRLGGTYMRACRFADQLRCNQRNLEIAVELRDLQMQLTANINLGVVYGVLGDIAAAIAATLAARELAARMDAASSDGLAASNLAGFYIEDGRLDDASRLLDEAIPALERTGSRYVLCESFVYRARIAAARGDLVSAQSYAQRSLSLARSLGNQLDAAIAQRILAQIESRGGDHDAARERIEEALVQATIHDELEAIKTRAARARILAAAGDPSAPGEFGDLRYDLTRLGTQRELAVLERLDEVR